MAAPTPVSALLHAATMVTAGIFLLLRITTDIQWQLSIVASSGAFSILFGGTLAVLASDIKQIIAYSTTSQLGQLALSSGVSNYSGALFHLFTHAFFKAFLFLTAGGLIHQALVEQRYYILGGLNKVLPLDQIFTLSRSLVLVGYPSYTGFQSKEYIIYSTFSSYLIDDIFLFLYSNTAILLTTRYSTRLILLPYLRRKLSLSLPIFIILGMRTNKLVEITILPLMVQAGVIGYLSSDAFVTLGSDYFYDSSQLTSRTQERNEAQVTTFILIPFLVVILGSPFYRNPHKPITLNKVR